MKFLLSLSLLSLPCGVLSAETVATCINTLSVDTDTNSCWASVSDTQINDGSSGSNISVFLDHLTVPAGTTPVTLHVNGDGGVAGCAIIDTCATQVTVNDIESPTIDCNQHVMFDLDPMYQMYALTPYDLAYTWNDNCDWEDLTTSVPGGIPTFGCEHVGTLQPVNVEVSDLAGNTGSCTSTVEVTDYAYTCSPTIASCVPAETLVADQDSCYATLTAERFDNGSTGDNLYFMLMNSSPLVGSTTITTEVSGSNGIDHCTTDVTVVDQQPPTITCNNWNSFDVGLGGLLLRASDMASATDNCLGYVGVGASTLISFLGGEPTFGCAEAGTTQSITMVATDGGGNTATCSADVMVTDWQYSCSPTVASCVSALTYDAEPGSCYKDLYNNVDDFDNGSSGDNIYKWLLNSMPNVGTSTVSLEVSGSAGIDWCDTTVTIVDTQVPSIICHSDFDYDLTYYSRLTVDGVISSASDNCWEDLTKSIQGGVPEYTCADVGSVNVVTGVATDASGNTATCDVTITVTDTYNNCNTPPVGAPTAASCVGAMSYDTDPYVCSKDIFALDPTTFDSGSTGDNLWFSFPDYVSPPVGTSAVTLQVSGDGGTDYCTTQVTVNDVEPPTISCVDQWVDIVNYPNLHVAYMGTAWDNCGWGSDVPITAPGGLPTFGCEHVGTQIVTLMATDPSGNTATCDSTITVTDDSYSCSPTIATCLGATTINTDPGTCHGYLTENTLDAGSTGLSLFFMQANTYPAAGAHTLTTEVYGLGGYDSCDTVVTVVDTESPVISCYDFTFDVGGQDWYGTSLPPSMLGMASDNCVFGYAGVTVNFQGGEPTFGCADVDTVHSITMEATDDSGNTATCVSSVTVIDSLYSCRPTVASCVSTLTYNTDPGSCYKDLYNNVDDFDSGSSGQSLYKYLWDSYPSVGSHTMTMEVSGSGIPYMDRCTTDLTIVDAELPTIDCVSEFTYYVGQSAPLQYWDIITTYSDNCWDGLTATVQATDISYGCSDVNSTYTVTGVVTDSSGNTATCDVPVTVLDSTGCCAVIGTVPRTEVTPPTTPTSPTGPPPPTAPTSPTGSNTEGNGDPHFTTWTNEHFEFHGQCDLIMMSDPSFADDAGLDIHIRTKLVRFWSYIKSTVIRIGNDILEIEGGNDESVNTPRYWMNYEYQGELNEIGGFPVSTSSSSPMKREYKIDLDSKYPGQFILIKIFKEFVGVKVVNGSEEAFGKTVGIVGDFKTGNTLARDGTTVLHDFEELGNEWQVLPSDHKLFHEIEAPQFPEKCIMPEDPRGERRRRLEESTVAMEEAEKACAHLKDAATVKDCVYDVLATQDLDMVGAF